MADVSLRENIIAQLGVQSLPEKMREQLVAQMTALAERRIIIRLLQELPEEKLSAARELDGAPEKLVPFLMAQVPSAMQLMQQEVETVRSETLLAGHVELTDDEA